jgi:hypothetical protein
LYKKPEWSFDLRTLACEHVGMSRNYECWRLKQKLQPAIDELTEAGFLREMDPESRFKKTGRGQWSVTFARCGGDTSAFAQSSAEASEQGGERSEMEAELITRGVTPKTARELAASFPEERIYTQIEQVDWVQKKGARKIADLGAYLTTAIRDNYASPKGFVSKAEKAEQQRAMNERRRLEAAATRQKRERHKQRDEANAKLREFWDGLTAEGKEAFDAEAIAVANPENVKLYEEAKDRGRVHGSLFRFLIRSPHMRTKLGLPPDDGGE